MGNKNFKTRKIKVNRTNNGYPAMWDHVCVGRMVGEAMLICGSDGKPKQPIYVKKNGFLNKNIRSLYVIEKEDWIVFSYRFRGDYYIEAWVITEIEEDFAICEREHCYENGSWDVALPWELLKIVEAARKRCMNIKYMIHENEHAV